MYQFVVVASINAMSQVFGWVTCVTHLMAGVTRTRDCATPLYVMQPLCCLKDTTLEHHTEHTMQPWAEMLKAHQRGEERCQHVQPLECTG